MAYQYTTIDGQRVEVTVAAAYKKLEAAFKSRWGLDLIITSGTRTRAEQQYLYDGWIKRLPGFNLAARPGTSNHEEGGPRGPRALDLRDSGRDAGVTVIGSPRSNWLAANCGRYGFTNAGHRFSPPEGWHYEYTGALGAAPAGGSGMWDAEKRQRFLNQVGLDTGGVDNGWGAMSDAALKTFQRWMGLVADGDWGSKTQAAAELIMKGGNFTKRPVKEIQTFLKAKGLYPGAIDNAWGNGSSMGTYRYQKSAGLTADAQWGTATDAKAFPPKPEPKPPAGTVLDPAAPWKKQTPDSGLASWVGSPNYNNSSSGQGAKTKTHIDHHWFGTDASLSGTDAHFQNPGTVKNGRGTGASSQYGIGADGTVHQYVLEKDYAHTNGTYEANATGITIEHEGGPGKPVTEATIQKSAELHADIARRHGWAKLEWMVNVFPHKHYVATQCPGTLPSEEIIRRANLLLNPPAGTVVVAKTELMALRAQVEAQQKTLGVLAATVTGWLS